MRAVRSILASSHSRPASSPCASLSASIAWTTPSISNSIPKPVNRVHSSSLASSSQKIYPKLSTTDAPEHTLTEGQEIQAQRTSIPPLNGWSLLHYVFGLSDMVDWPDVITPLFRYRELLETSVLRSDEHQMQIIRKLQGLHDRLLVYTPPQVPDPPKPSGLVRLRIIISCVTT